MRPSNVASAVVRRLDSSAGSVTLLHGWAREYDGRSDAGAFSLKLVRRGRATWTSERRSVTLSETMFTFLPAEAPYEIRIASDEPVETACFFFPKEMFSSVASAILPSARLLDTTPPPRTDWPLSVAAADARIVSPLVHLVTGAVVGTAAIDDVVMRVVPLLFTRFCAGGPRRVDAVRPSTRQELYRRAMIGREWLLDHLTSRTSVADAARAASMSPFHFHRTFHAVFGVTPGRYVTERRLERAAYLLSHTAARITDICLESGFQSIGSFVTAFRRRFGRSPREYRAAAN